MSGKHASFLADNIQLISFQCGGDKSRACKASNNICACHLRHIYKKCWQCCVTLTSHCTVIPPLVMFMLLVLWHRIVLLMMLMSPVKVMSCYDVLNYVISYSRASMAGKLCVTNNIPTDIYIYIFAEKTLKYWNKKYNIFSPCFCHSSMSLFLYSITMYIFACLFKLLSSLSDLLSANLF